MLTSRYMASQKNIPAIMNQIAKGTAPSKFTVAHLKSLGFKGSNDRAVIPLLKDLGFLTEDGSPTQRYHDYRDSSKSKTVMADALRHAYDELFHINATPSAADKSAIMGKFKSAHNVTDGVAQHQATTFLKLLPLADLSAGPATAATKVATETRDAAGLVGQDNTTSGGHTSQQSALPNLRYTIEIHLPPSKEIEVYNAIFKSLKEHLLV